MSEPLDRIIIDADLCIKLGNSEKYPFLREVLPLLAKDICIHACAYDEVKMPHCAVEHRSTVRIQNLRVPPKINVRVTHKNQDGKTSRNAPYNVGSSQIIYNT